MRPRCGAPGSASATRISLGDVPDVRHFGQVAEGRGALSMVAAAAVVAAVEEEEEEEREGRGRRRGGGGDAPSAR